MDERVQDIWTEYRRVLEEAYPESEDGRYFVGRSLDDETLERIVDLSEQLTNALGEQLGDRPPVGGPPYEALGGEGAGPGQNLPRLEHEAAAFAATGIDLAVAVDVMEAFRDEADGAAEEFPLSSSIGEEFPSMTVLLELASQAFGEEGQTMEGAAPGPPWVIEFAGQTIEDLVGRGSEPAGDFGIGLVSVGFSGIANTVGSFGPIHELVKRARGHIRLGARLFRSGIKKLTKIVGSEDFLAWIYEKLVERFVLRPSFPRSVREVAVRKIVRAESSLERVTIMVDSGHTPGNRSQLEDGLADLYRCFARNMWWAGLAEKLISRSALIVAIVGAGIAGHAALAVAYGVGLTVCLFTLADRLDTVPGELGWVRGVPTLVRDS